MALLLVAQATAQAEGRMKACGSDPLDAHAGRARHLHHVILWASVLICSTLRFIDLSADLPPWLPSILTDEGWYADPARGKVLFEDYFSDDVGSAYLTAPLHTFLTEVSFRMFGVGNWQARIVPATCGALLLALAAVWLCRRFGAALAAVGVLFLGFDPTLWVHCRFGLTETLQSLLIATSAVLLLGGDTPTGRRAFLAGSTLGLAFATKLNAVTFGLIPIIAGGIVHVRRTRLDLHEMLRITAAFVAGGLLITSLFAVSVWIPHWSSFLETLHTEAGSLSWHERVASLGLILARGMDDGSQRVLWVLGRSPALLCASWLGAVLFVTAPAARAQYMRMLGLLVWVAMMAVVTFLSYRTWERRFVLLLPGLLLPGLLYLHALSSRRTWSDAQVASRAGGNGTGTGLRLVQTALMTLPAFVLFKPWSSNWMAEWIGSPASDLSDLKTGFAGLAVLAVWGLACLLLRPVLSRFLDCAVHLTLFRIGPVALVAALGFEVFLVTSSLVNAGHTLDELQRELRRLGDGQDIVVGQDSSTLFLPTRLRTVRISYDNRFGPPPNPDVVDRLRPRFFVDGLDSRLLHGVPHAASLYRPLQEVAIFRENDGSYRHRFRIWERQ